MYTFKVYGEKKEKKKAKGISMCTKEHHLTFSMYEEALRKKKAETVAPKDLIRSGWHQLYIDTIQKKCLSAFDDKRYILEDGVSSYAYGHYKIKT